MKLLSFKNNRRVLSVGITFFILFSAIFCCCLSSPAHAKQSVPSCHKSSQSSPSDESNNKDCCRLAKFSTVEKQSLVYSPVVITELIVLAYLVPVQWVPSSDIINYVLKDSFKSSPPLYIQHSVLRI